MIKTFVFDSTGHPDAVLSEMRTVINAVDQESAFITRAIWGFYNYIASTISHLDDVSVITTVNIDDSANVIDVGNLELAAAISVLGGLTAFGPADNFAGDALDTDKWPVTDDLDGAITVDDKLVLEVDENTEGVVSLTTNPDDTDGVFDVVGPFAAHSCFINILTLPALATLSLKIHDAGDTNFIQVNILDDALSVLISDEEEGPIFEDDYDIEEQKYIGLIIKNNIIRVVTSPDKNRWVTVFSATNTIDLSEASATLSLATSDDDVAAQTAEIGGFNI